MSWKKYFRTPSFDGQYSPVSSPSASKPGNPGFTNYQSHLPEVYSGHPNRIERYNQYEQMAGDSDVSAALDILAEFSTQINVQNNTVFDIIFHDTPTNSEIQIIKDQLTQWYKLNEFGKRMFKLFRNTIKYGDQVFVRDPETFKLYWSEMSKLMKVIVNESEGKKPEQYVFKDINPNLQNLSVTAVGTTNGYLNTPRVGGPNGLYTPLVSQPGGSSGSRFNNLQSEAIINAEHVLHLSLNEGLDPFWPFGNSVLESVFKVYKQKELLEDSIIIYRIQRAPERRVFKIDVGTMPPHLQMAFIDRVKNEVHQRRIPTQSSSGANQMDASYNPLSIGEDFFFPHCLALDTKIKLDNGCDATLSELIEDFKQGKTNWTYTFNPKTREINRGEITWAGVTRTNAEVIKINLTNGQYVICTPDHKFIMHDGSEIEAKDLLPGGKPKTVGDQADISILNTQLLDYVIDTGDITVTSPCESHNFALSSGIFVHNSADGRGSSVEILAGGSNVGEITDLRFFSNKLFRGLKIPSAYLPTQNDEASNTYTDGKVGAAMIQEWRFNQYCKRLQSHICEALNREFKMFMRFRGINIDNGLFDLVFTEPQNFTKYRQIEIDASRIQAFTLLESYPYLSKRFILERYLGLSKDEILQNENMVQEEMASETAEQPEPNLRSVGITPGGMSTDMNAFDAGEEGDMDMESPYQGDQDFAPPSAPANTNIPGTEAPPAQNTPPAAI